MTEDERRRFAIVWDRIEQSAFRPDKTKSWLGSYSKQLRHLLQLEPVWIKYGSQGIFQITEVNIACEYMIESPNAYVACLKKSQDERTIWSVHADASYLSKAALHMAEVNYPDTAIDTHLRSDIASVLDGMLFHPCNHAHLSAVGFSTAGDTNPTCGMLKADEIRVTSSAYNGFIFLYHLAYQLCVVSKEARAKEKTRLIGLFENAIRSNSSTVNVRNLFNFQDRSN
jgi:hypothetical protein